MSEQDIDYRGCKIAFRLLPSGESIGVQSWWWHTDVESGGRLSPPSPLPSPHYVTPPNWVERVIGKITWEMKIEGEIERRRRKHKAEIDRFFESKKTAEYVVAHMPPMRPEPTIPYYSRRRL